MKQASSPDLASAEAGIGHRFKDRSLLLEALTHRSFSHESAQGHVPYNERLEFLGDSVVGLIAVEYLYLRNPDYSEALLAKIKSHVVSEKVLSEFAGAWRLGEFLRLGRGESLTGGTKKRSILANCFEAVVAALYLDAGYVRTREIVMSAFRGRIDSIVAQGDFFDYKTELQERTQKELGVLPEYHLLQESGEEHARIFTVAVCLQGQRLAIAQGRKKKEAESLAAKEALRKLADGSTGSSETQGVSQGPSV